MSSCTARSATLISEIATMHRRHTTAVLAFLVAAQSVPVAPAAQLFSPTSLTTASASALAGAGARSATRPVTLQDPSSLIPLTPTEARSIQGSGFWTKVKNFIDKVVKYAKLFGDAWTAVETFIKGTHRDVEVVQVDGADITTEYTDTTVQEEYYNPDGSLVAVVNTDSGLVPSGGGGGGGYNPCDTQIIPDASCGG